MGRRWWLGALLGLVGWLAAYADRAVFGPLLAPIGRAFGVGPAALGLLSSSFFLAYTALQLPAGALADRVPPARLLAGSFFGFGAAVLASGAAPTFALLVALTAVAGAFQSVYYPAQYALLARALPAERLALGNALANSGMGVGIALGFAVGGLPRLVADWRGTLAGFGLGTVAVGAAFLLLAPRVQPVARRAEPVPLGRDIRLLLLANFGSLFGFFFFLAWFPYYLSTALGLHGAALALASAAPPLLSAPAGILWSAFPAERRRLFLRLFLPLSGLALAVLPLTRGGVPLAAILLVYGLVGKLPTDPLLLTETTSRLPPAAMGRGLGLLNFVGMLASVCAPAVAGFLDAATRSFRPAFWLAAALLGVASAAVLALGPPPAAAPARTPTSRRP
jgi:MFS family permease